MSRASRATATQPAPHGTGRAITPLVIADLQERSRVGIAKYGEPLRAHNGRSALWDAYQELLDGASYLRQLIEELDHPLIEHQEGTTDDDTK